MSYQFPIRLRTLPVAVSTIAILVGCTVRDAEWPSDSGSSTATDAALSGRITIDGSSTVYPITQAVAEEFMKLHPNVGIPVGLAGTGGGLKRFVVGQLDICDASRQIDPGEVDACRKNGVDYVELKVGIDGLSVVVNPRNTWCDHLSVGQLKRLWEAGSKIRKWNELDPAFPNEDILLYGPDADSGTFEYFTEAVCGKPGNSRTDYQPSSNDNVLIQGVKGDVGALGYFGYAYYAMNKDSLKVLRIAVDDDRSAIAPNEDTILSGKYSPLSRPLFLYVNKKALKRPETIAFLDFYLDRGPSLISEVHYIPLPADQYADSRAQLTAAQKVR